MADEDEIRSSAQLLSQNKADVSFLSGVFAVMDSARMPCVGYSDLYVQNAYWEGFIQGNEVTNLFVRDFRGLLIHAAINYTGSWHDSRVALDYGLYGPIFESQTPTGFAVLTDRAFPRSGGFIQGKLLLARKANEHGSSSEVLKSAWLVVVDEILERSMPSERKSPKWA